VRCCCCPDTLGLAAAAGIPLTPGHHPQLGQQYHHLALTCCTTNSTRCCPNPATTTLEGVTAYPAHACARLTWLYTCQATCKGMLCSASKSQPCCCCFSAAMTSTAATERPHTPHAHIAKPASALPAHGGSVAPLLAMQSTSRATPALPPDVSYDKTNDKTTHYY
jgi:hypothetical protein